MAKRLSSSTKFFAENIPPPKQAKKEAVKDLSPATMSQLQQMVKKLIDESTNELRDTIIKQNEFIVELVSQNNSLMKQLIVQRKAEQEFTAKFPIETMDDLKQLNDDLADSPIFDNYVTAMKSIIKDKGGLTKALKKLFSSEIITSCNYNGTNGKFAFRSLSTLEKALFKSASGKDYTEEEYIKQIREGFSKIKKAHHKKACILRKLNQNNNNNNDPVSEEEELQM